MKEAVDYLGKKDREKEENQDPVEEENVICFRVKQELWGEVRTLIVYRSKNLYEGQLRGIERSLEKKFEALAALNKSLSNPRCKKTRKEVIASVKGLVKGQFVKDIITWKLPRKHTHYRVEYGLDPSKFEGVKRNRLGYRILMTDRHEWLNKEIITAYHGQSKVEYAFKNLENPYHGSAHPQFHWTDQKIRVHVFTCILGFLFESVVYRRALKKEYGQTNYDNLFDRLERIRLAALIEDRGKGKAKQLDVHYQLEEAEAEDELLLDALCIRNLHIKRPQLKGLVVYK